MRNASGNSKLYFAELDKPKNSMRKIIRYDFYFRFFCRIQQICLPIHHTPYHTIGF